MIVFYLGICSTAVALILSIVFWKMRSLKSMPEHDSSSSDETSESESEENICSDEILHTDAVNSDRNEEVYSMRISDVENIEQTLDDYDKISLIFLLSDNPQDCLNKIELSEWAREEILKNRSWDKKLWEAFAIIKNFQVPKKYGISKEQLIKNYFPFQYFTATHISKFKKVLFIICENFKKENENLFLEQLKKDFRKRNLTFPDELAQMEMYLSYLLKIGYISTESVQNCSKVAKTLSMEYEYDLFKFIEEENAKSKTKESKLNEQYSNCSSNIFSGNKRDDSTNELKKPKLSKQYSNGTSNISSDDEIHYARRLSIANSDSTQDNVPRGNSTEDNYNMDRHKICLIIDQENFYKEIDQEFKNLLPPNINEEPLHPRVGTQEDSKRLKSVLESRNFQVETLRNRSHLKMIDGLEKFVSNIDKRTITCFLIIILSHGGKDVVYGANSCYVEISRIIRIMDKKKFLKIPKGLILQACQGQGLLEHVDENIDTDGAPAIESSDLKSQNCFLFSSTVPGYASIRDKSTGTWFIQSLCDQIEQFADSEHIAEIVTRVTRDVGNNKWRRLNSSYQMIPYFKSTLFDNLYI